MENIENTTQAITPDSLKLFLELAADAGNWNGTPLLELDASERGNLTQLKKAGLVYTGEDDGCTFAYFEPAGVELAAEHGVDLSWIGA